MKIEKIQGFRSIDSNADKINELIDAATEHELKIASLYDQLNGFRAVMRKNGWDVKDTYPQVDHAKTIEMLKLINVVLLKTGKRYLLEPCCDQCEYNVEVKEIESFSGRVYIAYCPKCGNYLKVMKETQIK